MLIILQLREIRHFQFLTNYQISLMSANINPAQILCYKTTLVETCPVSVISIMYDVVAT